MNIVLIGLSGSGKTTIGRLLSNRLGLGFLDLDESIENNTGMTILEIFKYGEEYFRDLETQAVSDASQARKTVISTGGGVIKRPYNMDLLSQNGFIIFIDRPLERIMKDIELDSRPLLKEGIHKLHELYKERYDLYIKYCHARVENIDSAEAAVEASIRLFESYVNGNSI